MDEITQTLLDAINLIRIDIFGTLYEGAPAIVSPPPPVLYMEHTAHISTKCQSFFTNRFIRLITEQPEQFQDIYELLEDDESKQAYLDDIKNRILQSYFPSFLSDELANSSYKGAEHRKDLINYKSDLSAHHLNFDAGDVETFLKKQYTIPHVFEPEAGDTVFDIGSFNGGTALFLSRYIGDNGKVYTFEPFPAYFERVKNSVASISNIEAWAVGFSSRKGSIHFIEDNAVTRASADGTTTCEIDTIDDFVAQNKIQKVDFIKMDVEGEELKVLYGAVETIRRDKPKLAICIYHNQGEDMLTIPLALNKLDLGYRFYVRKYHISVQELVLMAVCK